MAIAAAVLPPPIAAQINTTTVQGTVYRADGTPASGTLLLSWSAFTTPQNQAVAAGNLSTAIGADGFVTLNLTPNANALPTGSYYSAVYHLSDGTVNQEYWVVPAAANASIASVRAQLQPSTVAVQPVSKSYLDSAIASLNGSWLPLAGGTLSGPLSLNGDPVSANQASTKHYADQLAAAQLPLSGGTVAGPLNAKQIEGRLYADQWQSGSGTNDGIAMSLAQCALYPYACQVIAPATYAQTEHQQWTSSWGAAGGTYPPATAPAGSVIDERFGGLEISSTSVPPPSWASNGNNFRGGEVMFSMNNTVPANGIYYNPAPALWLNESLLYGGWNFSNNQSTNYTLRLNQSQFAQASDNGITQYMWGNGNGDHIDFLSFDLSKGGTTAGDNEGNETKLIHAQWGDVFQGKLNAISAVATGTSPCVAPCSVMNVTQTQGLAGDTGDGLANIDLTQAYTAGLISSIGYNNAAVTSTANWDNAFGDSTAHTTTTQAIAQGSVNNLFPMTNVTITVASSSGFSTASPACIFDATGRYWECQKLTAVGNGSLTFAVLDEPMSSGSVVAQGGMTGMGFEMVADEVSNTTPNIGGAEYGPGALPLRTVYPIMYNVSGDTAYIITGVQGAFGWAGTNGYNQMGSGGSVTATVSGGVVTACSANGGSGYGGFIVTDASGYLANPPQLSYAVNSGGTPPVLALTSLGSGGSLSGCTVVSPGASLTSVAVTVTPTNSYAVYPMSRSVNVWNPTTGAVDGSSIATDQPMGRWVAGDTIEQEPMFTNAYVGLRNHVTSYSRGTAMTAGYDLEIDGNMGNAFGARVWDENNPRFFANWSNSRGTPWVIGSGKSSPPVGYELWGPFSNGLYMSYPPIAGISSSHHGVVSVGCDDPTQGTNYCSTWLGSYEMLSAANQQGNGYAEDALSYNPTTYSWQITAGATGPGGYNSYCNETLTGSANGGLSISCSGKTTTLDTSGNLSLPGVVRAQGGVTGATINGEFTVDGTTYTTLNAAWNAAASLANSGGQNQTVRLGPGNFTVTATLAEPTNGACVSLIGSAAPTVTADNTNASTVITVASHLPGDLFSLQNTAGSQAQSCTFQNFLVMANKNVNHAFNLQWFRGLYVDDVTVNDTTQDAFYLGETGGSHQANFEMRNVTVSYSSSNYTPAARPNYGLNLQSTVLDSFVQNLLVRNALQAAVYNAGGGITFELIHGFGYPYTCTTAPCNNSTETNASAADASWATNYEVVDAGSGGNMYFNTYMDSPAIAAFDLKSNGVQINGGHIQWPETTSFPNATFAEVEASVNSNLVIANVDCLNMSNTAGIPGSPAGTTGNWISYMGASGVTPSYSSVSNLAGCGQYVQQRVSARQTAFDTAGNNSSNTNYGSGQVGVTPKVFVTPLSSQANEGGVEVENFSGGQGDSFFSGFSGQPSNFAVMADGTVRHTGLQTSAVIATGATTLTKANHIVLANASSGGFTLTLPSCYTAMPDGLTPTGMEFTIVRTDTSSNAVQLATTSGETIEVGGNKSTSYSLSSAGGLTLACGPDSNWYTTEQIGMTGNAATATALAATPTQCPAGYYATGIAANGNASCSQSWHFTWYGNFAGTFGTSTNNSLGAIWSPSAAISTTRLDIAVGTAPSGCSTYPVIGIYDSTASSWLKTVTLAAGTYSYRNAVSGVSIAAGHNLSMGVQTAGVGCTTNAGSAQLTMEYTMNQ